MNTSWLRVAALGVVPFIGACAQDSGADIPPNAISVNVAPLTLPGIGGASYDLTVKNGQAQTVWTKANVTAGQYGDGKGSISYVGPCDADTTPAGNEINTIELVLNNLFDTDGTTPLTAADYTNPCPAGTPCVLSFECIENADVAVTYNLTIMRSANQGFFDIAVNFDNVFCSAKFDTCYADENGVAIPGSWIDHLFALDGNRHHTGILALACTGGPNNANATRLFLDDLVVTCGGTALATIDPAGSLGNGLSPALAHTSGDVWQYAITAGQELLDCAGTSCDKAYWTVALGLEGLPANCVLTTKATASEGALPGSVAGTIPVSASYPVINVNVPLTDRDAALLCSVNPLGSAGVSIGYTVIDPNGTATTFANQLTQDPADPAVVTLGAPN